MTEHPRNDRRGAFAALVAAAKAIEQRRPDDLVAALQAVSQRALLRVAARHRCLGYLRRGILELGIRSGRATALAETLRAYAGKAALQAYAVRGQLERLVRVLDEAAVPFALLKGSARLFRGDKEADCNTMYDLDVFVPKEEALRAVAELQRGGYRSDLGERRSAHYWARHHHLAPLQPPELGLPIELHMQLAPPDSLSIATDWCACQTYFEQVVKRDVEATCFNALGTAVHLTIHGAGVRRLHDVIMLSRILRDDESMYDRVLAGLAHERRQPVALQAVLALGARIAGIDVQATPAVQRYLLWVLRREDLVPYVRDRSQFADAWYCNGGKLWGPATRQALTDECDPDQNAVTYPALFVYRLVGRIATSAYAAALAARASTALP